jgi:DNA-binding MarR family transcriptional regulator
MEARLRRERERRPPTKSELCCLADELYEARRMRDRMLDQELFGEPAWDMLLALYCMPNRGICLGVTSLSHAARVPEATGSRCQKVLLERGLIRRGPHVHDARQQLVGLTDKGRQLLEKYLIRIFDADRSRQSEEYRSSGDEPLQ